jgi:hypothetical protein
MSRVSEGFYKLPHNSYPGGTPRIPPHCNPEVPRGVPRGTPVASEMLPALEVPRGDPQVRFPSGVFRARVSRISHTSKYVHSSRT